MKILFKYLLCFVLVLGCKKKTEIKFVVYNPTTNTYKSNVTIEVTRYYNKRIGTLVGPRDWEPDAVVAKVVTDANGIAIVSDLKLERGKNVRYYCTPSIPQLYANDLTQILSISKENHITFNAYW